MLNKINLIEEHIYLHQYDKHEKHYLVFEKAYCTFITKEEIIFQF